MTRALVATVVLASSVASADAPKRPKDSPCVTIDELEDGKIDISYYVWTDAKGRPTYFERVSDRPRAYTWTYDADGRVAKTAVVREETSDDFSYRYGEHGEILEIQDHRKSAKGETTDVYTFAWTGKFGDNVGPPAYSRMIPLLDNGPQAPSIGGSAAYDVPHFTGTVEMSAKSSTATEEWTFVDAKHTIRHGSGKDRYDVTVAPTKDGYTRTVVGGQSTSVQTWSGGRIVDETTQLGDSKITVSMSYDDKGRWTGSKSPNTADSLRVTYTCK